MGGHHHTQSLAIESHDKVLKPSLRPHDRSKNRAGADAEGAKAGDRGR